MLFCWNKYKNRACPSLAIQKLSSSCVLSQTFWGDLNAGLYFPDIILCSGFPSIPLLTRLLCFSQRFVSQPREARDNWQESLRRNIPDSEQSREMTADVLFYPWNGIRKRLDFVYKNRSLLFVWNNWESWFLDGKGWVKSTIYWNQQEKTTSSIFCVGFRCVNPFPRDSSLIEMRFLCCINCCKESNKKLSSSIHLSLKKSFSLALTKNMARELVDVTKNKSWFVPILISWAKPEFFQC